MNKKSDIIIIQDRASLIRCYTEFLKEIDSNITVIQSGSEALEYFNIHISPKLVILDLQIQDMDGFELLSNIKFKSPESEIVVITTESSVELSSKVMDLGALDYLQKPFTRDRLCVTVKNALNHFKLEKIANPFGGQFEGFIGSSIEMQTVYQTIGSAAASSKASIFITGESGTGKEVCAHSVHNLSTRADNECVILNCAAIPNNLMESEIFGHVKGAFTGADKERIGAAERANGGTLFLDEIGEMEMELQSKLLRFIQTGTFNKVGSNKQIEVDTRFICATNRDPLLEIKNGRFREDLYYRLNVVQINLPPLRERGKDILSITEHFLKEFSQEEGKGFNTLSQEAKQIFLAYDWPGNVRQLLNVIRNIVVLNDGSVITKQMLPSPLNIFDPNRVISKDIEQHNSRDQESKTESTNTPLKESFEISTIDQTEKLSNIESITHLDLNNAKESDNSKIDQLSEFNTNNSKHASVELETMDDNQKLVKVMSEIKIAPLKEMELLIIQSALQACNGNITHAASFLKINPSTIHRKLSHLRKSG